MPSRGSRGTKGILLRLKSTVAVGSADESPRELPAVSVALGEIPTAAGAQAANNPTLIRAYRDNLRSHLIKIAFILGNDYFLAVSLG